MEHRASTGGGGLKGGRLNQEEWEDEQERRHRSRSSIGDEIRLSKELAARRRRIGFWRHPIVTLRHFGKCLARWARSSARAVAAHPAFALVAIPGVAAWVVLETFPGPHTAAMIQAKHVVKFVVWWVGLGTVSSVGLGCGFQTGVLFLFPHIMKTCLAVEECNSLDFPSSDDMWFSASEGTFSCEGEEHSLNSALQEALFETEGGGGEGMAGPGPPVSFFATFMKVYPACLLWGIGTAIGEIPPYALSYAAAEAGEEEDEEEELWELEHRDPKRLGTFDLVTRTKMWMIGLLKRKGFMGVFLLASVPNMAFDLCGMCCGHFMMPFSTFFSAVLLGKAGVKVSLCRAAYEDKETLRIFAEGNRLREKEKHRAGRRGRGRGLSSASFFEDRHCLDSDNSEDDFGNPKDRKSSSSGGGGGGGANDEAVPTTVENKTSSATAEASGEKPSVAPALAPGYME
eukprot:g1573.t1